MSAPSRRPSPRSEEAPSVLETAFAGLVRQRAALILVLIVAGLGAAGVAMKLGKEQHRYQGRLLYTPNRVTEPYYSSPELSNLVGVIGSQPRLSQIREAVAEEMGLDELQRQLQIEAFGDATVVITMRHHSPQDAQAISNYAMQVAVEATNQIRQEAISVLAKDAATERDRSRDHYEQLRDQLASLLQERGFPSQQALREEIASLRREISAYELQAELATVSQKLTEAQRDRLRSTFETPELPQGDAEGDAGDGVKQASFVGSKAIQTRTLLQDALRVKSENASLDAQIEVKQREFERAKSLHDRQLISDAAFERVRGELLTLQVQNRDDIRTLRQQLRRVNDQIMTAAGPNGTDGSLSLTAGIAEPSAGQQTIALLEGSGEGAQFKTEHLATALKNKQQRLDQAIEASEFARSAIEETELAYEEWIRLESQAEQFAQSARSTASELVVTQPALPLPDGVTSNYTKLFGATFVALSLLMIAPAFVQQLSKAQRVASESRVVQGSPLLGRVVGQLLGGRSQRDRFALIAVRLRAVLGEGAHAVMITSNTPQTDHVAIAHQIAVAAADTGESVAVIDCNRTRPLVTSAANPVRDITAEESQEGQTESKAGDLTLYADRASAGDLQIVSAELLMTPSGAIHRGTTRDTLDVLRQSHSLVIVISAPISDQPQTETLASVCDGFITVSHEGDLNEPELGLACRQFTRLGAKLCGAVIDC